MDFSWRFDSWFKKLPKSGSDSGSVVLIVVRPAGEERGLRSTPASVAISPEGGVEGDKWAVSEDPQVGAQVSLMNAHVLRAVAGSEEDMKLAGDNLIVDLELSEANLPIGTRLQVGTVTLEVSSIPHQPCAEFKGRFGSKSAKRIGRATRMGQRGRGLMTQVIEAGNVKLGDEIRVLRNA